jgi:CxxC motif-containing protein (DUF1111 family)
MKSVISLHREKCVSKKQRTSAALRALECAALLAVILNAQSSPSPTFGNNGPKDPGVRGGDAGAGAEYPELTAGQRGLFASALGVFKEVDSVMGTLSGEEGKGLGPSFNLNSCAGCHAFPDVGGTSPAINPQVAVATLHGARNDIPSFIKADGPVREARFKKNADGSPDGGVHDLFTIRGRMDAPSGCQIQQTDFDSQLARNNVIFRIPTPTFGLGLVEAIEDATILANKNSNLSAKGSLGISGRENRNGNDGTITRFGWKAQNKSLVIFSGEAYHVEQGVTNEAFPNPREAGTGCTGLGHPEDHSDSTSGASGDVEQFAMFMRMLAPPTPVTAYGDVKAPSIKNGHDLFVQIGCVYCHTETLKTGLSSIAALSNHDVPLFSDLLVHNMGSGLSDGVSQGVAGPDEFRTAPLWGLGKRIFLLHDGRTKDLVNAIKAHSSQSSEANGSVDAFNRLNDSNTQDLLNFLRSL